MRHTTLLLTSLLLLCAGPSPAAADSLTATLRQPLKEVAHTVDIRIKRGVAILTVRRTFANAGTRHDEASLRIHLPYGAAATGLRIRGKKRWFNGELMEAAKAAALYKKLTGFGPHTPRDPALLYWVWANEIHLQVFPVPPKGRSTVEYTLTVPTRYSGGRYTLSYPRHSGAKNLAVPLLRIHPGTKRARITVNDRKTIRGKAIALPKAVVRALPGTLQREGGASYTVSSLKIARRGVVRSVKVSVDIRHTYRGDLKVQLVSPSGRSHMLHDCKGGGKNHLRKTYEVKLAQQTALAGTWHLVVSDHARMDVGQLVAWSVQGKVGSRTVRQRAKGLPLVLADAPAAGVDLSQATVRVTPPRIRTVAGRLGRVVAGKGKQFFRLELDAAPRLRPLPKRLSVVFVVDASHSVKAEGLAVQLRLARAYLSHVPGARFEVVLYRRYAKRLVGSFARATTFRKQVQTARRAGKLALGNGSALDQGLRLASRLLRKRRGTRRIVMLSDDLLKPRWTNRAALRALARAPRGTIAHVVLPEISDSSEPITEERDDKHRLAPLAAKRGGVLLHIKELSSKRRFKDIVPVVLGLVRPIRIDHFRITGLPAKHGISVPTTFAEGAGLREMALLKRAPTRVTLRGKIWAKSYRRVVGVNRRFTRATAAFVFSHDLHGELSTREQMVVAKLGRVVSPVTSYLAIEPGVRPSTAGIDRRGRGGGSGAGFGGFGRGGGGGGGGRLPPDPATLLAPHVKRCVALHRPAAGWQLKLRLETTYDEVVDVVGRGKRSPMRRCLVEAAWTIRLTSAYNLRRESFDVTLP